MHNPYEIPEEPYYMMDELIKAFKSKSLVVCHMHRQLTIDALTSHGYFKRVNPSKSDIEAFKRAGSGKHLPSAFKYPSLPDNDPDHYNFYEVTIAGRTANTFRNSVCSVIRPSCCMADGLKRVFAGTAWHKRRSKDTTMYPLILSTSTTTVQATV